MRFNDRLRNIRQDRDLTQDKVSKALNIRRNTLSGYETTHRTPSIYITIEIARYFDVSVDYLLGLTDIETPFPK
ncbi:helix-turn-helix domain-containing protein [Clostridium lacusfryxellense]|uniref:helix-turn-helix domain-containing protein n=1 Tax=Clostridium lacusfryxellense TaxID=205328 RepID=UPI001C0E1825|nr:helix-turn-helix transcriptional regulator [Clostridium lacusfryxellense]MBU3112023.1 helix-turn-helix domain-containing protein [Clostridium lacusfryxellense]